MLLLLLLLSRFSHVRLCATLETAAHQAPPSLGFSRQEYWSGLPFPSPLHESEKWKWSRSVVSDFATPRTAAYQAPPSMGFSRQEYWTGLPLPSPRVALKSYEFNLLLSPGKDCRHPLWDCKQGRWDHRSIILPSIMYLFNILSKQLQFTSGNFSAIRKKWP